MSIFGDDGIDDILNGNLHNAEDQLPDYGDDNDHIFGDGEQPDGETQESGGTAVAVKVQPKKRNILNPRPRLNVEVLRGQRGLHTIEEYFKDIKFKGKGRETEDLDEIMRRLQHWGHRMYPTYKFHDVMTNIERLGKKKPLQVHMSRYRLGMLESIKNLGEINDVEDEDDQAATATTDEPYDEFDALLDEQIAISKVDPRTPGPSSSRYSGGAMGTSANTSKASSSFATPSFSRGNAVVSTPYTGQGNLNDSDLATPLPPSQPSTPAPMKLSVEQIARIAENRRLAQERLAAKKRQQEAQKAADSVQT